MARRGGRRHQTVVLSASAATTSNVLASADFNIVVAANPRLSSWTTDFCVFRTDGTAKPFIVQEELPLQINALAEGSEHEFQTE